MGRKFLLYTAYRKMEVTLAFQDIQGAFLSVRYFFYTGYLLFFAVPEHYGDKKRNGPAGSFLKPAYTKGIFTAYFCHYTLSTADIVSADSGKAENIS
jgi:hypothetical protein